MTKMEEAITMAAQEMSRDARIELVHQLLDGLTTADQQAVDEAWDIEIRRRLAALERGEGSSKPSDEVVARLRQKRSA